MNIDLANIRSIHFVGIKGVAMTALAIIVKEMGKRVSGSDTEEEFPTDATLEQFNIHYATQFSLNNISKDVDLVIYTGAHQGKNNIEVQTALRKNIPVLPHGKALGLLMNGKRQISVAGSHGKTTTSAMIASVLDHASLDPSFAIGCGEIMHLKTPAHYGKGEYFVAEADEYLTDPHSDKTPRFMWQFPEMLVITNIDFDHPDAYQDLEAVKCAFIAFTHNVPTHGKVILNVDDPASLSIKDQIAVPISTYGQAQSDYQLQNVTYGSDVMHFQVKIKGKTEFFDLHIPGEHNAHNATAVIAALHSEGFEIETIRAGLAEFRGTKRRFELIGEKNDKLLYDDYAHHPREIAATLVAIKQWFGDMRLIVIFQPHTYSRTQALLGEFSQCFAAADIVLITDIYASAREKPIIEFTSEKLVDKVQKYKKEVIYAPDRDNVVQYLEVNSRSNDLILTMGAGDIYSWIPTIFEAL